MGAQAIELKPQSLTFCVLLQPCLSHRTKLSQWRAVARRWHHPVGRPPSTGLSALSLAQLSFWLADMHWAATQEFQPAAAPCRTRKRGFPSFPVFPPVPRRGKTAIRLDVVKSLGISAIRSRLGSLSATRRAHLA